MELTIYTDGASRNNPGESGAGIYILRDGEPFEQIARYLGTTTNNIAEYTAAIIGLEHAAKVGARKVRLFADSELMVKQINGQYKVKNEGLKPLHTKVKGTYCQDRQRRGTIHTEGEEQGSGRAGEQGD